MEQREIKFRAWLKEEKKMAEYISHFKSASDGIFEITVPFEDVNSDVKLKTFRDFDLMQYTGLKDKNGKEIYENDLITCVGGYDTVDGYKDSCEDIRVVKWSEDSLQWVASCEYCNEDIPLFEFDLDRVVGNIYEHPTLQKYSEGDIM